MDWKKFFEPSWRKLVIFVIAFFVIEIVWDVIGSGVRENGIEPIFSILIPTLLWILSPVKMIVGNLIIYNQTTIETGGRLLLTIGNTAHLIWVYFLAGIVDKVVKK